MNKNLICSLAITSIFLSFYKTQCSELETRASVFKVKQAALVASHRLGKIDLYHDDEGFFVKRNDTTQRVNNYDVDPSLRNITNEGLESVEKLGGYISANEMDNSDITLRLNARGNGGGLLGATLGAVLGKATVSVIGHGAIQLVALGAGAVTGGPGYFIVSGALESTLGAAIEAASIKGAIAGGIALGTATGPV